MWLLPSKDPELLHRFFLWCRDTGLASPGLVMVEKKHFEENKDAYLGLLAPKGWNFHLTDADDFVGQIREAWPTYERLPWVGLLGDDCIPLSINWEKTVLTAVAGWNVVSVHDDRKAGSGGIGRGSVWSGDLMRVAGALFFEGFSEDEQYELWENVATATGSRTHRADIVIRRPGWEPNHVWANEKVRAWIGENGTPICEKIEDMKKARGIVKWEIDYTDVRLMVAVPSGSGHLDYEFLGCLHETFGMLTSAGVQHQFVIEPNNADIVMARSKLFAKFMRSDCTHLLMIDDDMGWTAQAVGRLFAAKKDFVAVAGPKKREPLQCAVTPLALDKNFGKIHFDVTTGTCEVAEVGGAFCLFTRAFGEKMIAAYPELQYAGIGAETEYSLFLPQIVDGAYKAEDYSLCNRWRKIGGEVHVCPDISLKHVGRKTYEGPWSDTWPKQEAIKEAAE